jgi:hypothetical protein
MLRLVYTYCLSWQRAVPAFVRNYLPTTTYTFYPLIAAVFLLLIPHLTKGQCYTLICNQNVQLPLGNDCTGSVNPYYMIQNNWSCQGPMTMKYYDAAGNAIGSTVTSAYLGQTLTVNVKHNWTGLTCTGTVYVTDKKKPVITTNNVTLNCTEDPSVAALGEPTVTDNCSSVIAVSHQDTVIDFGCGYTGFAGYFDPSNWTACLTNTGDGGVDVTGAPNSVLVEGAGNSPLSLNPRYVTRFKIVIPTEGYVSFDWSSFGGSSFNIDAFYLTINNWCIQLSNDTIQSGSYTTGLLHPGDVLSFEQASDGNADVVNTLISNFHFHTLAWKVINRKWTAIDEWGNKAVKTQVITLTRAQLSQVVFPPSHDGIEAPMLACGAAANLSVTGVPFIDEDGNLGTTDDQYAVDNGDCFFNLTHEDQVIPTCEGSELILRKWTVLDNCSSQIAEHTQLIKLFDVTPPQVTCPPSTVLSTEEFGCFGVINLPQATATDDCSPTVTITPVWNFGSGYGPFDDIAPGTYTVTYQAEDACGNVANCQTSVTIEDEVPPTVICDGFTVAALNEDGMAQVFANSVDDGSYDWCCISSFEIKRQNQPNSAFGPTLNISCNDLTQNVMVRLKVTDCNGNSNFCDVEVIVQDNHAPTITAPADVTVDCTTDLSDLSQFGQPNVYDNCQYNLIETIDQTFTSCGEGAVTRTWTATDPGGNTATAQQVIHLTNLSPWNLDGNQIVWPLDYATSGCSVSLEPFDLPAGYGGPILFGQNGCESVSVNFEDAIFWISEPSCYKIYRTWTIADLCQYQPGGSTGIWVHVQIIEMNDTEPPVFINPVSNINAAGSGCSGTVTIPFPAVSDCSDHITITVSGQLGSGFNFQNVPSGIYQMTYTASDGCGNTSTLPFTVTVGDSQPPAAGCLNGLTVNLTASGSVNVNASAFNLNSTDNCTPVSSLVYCYSSNPTDVMQTFDCDDLGLQIPIQLYVMDLGGNMGICQTFLLVQDNQNVCNPGATEVNVSGHILTPQGIPVAQVSTSISGAQSAPVTTAAAGDFMFENLPVGGNFILTPSKNSFPLNGVTAYDLVLINDHILGYNEFQHAWQFIAADANSSGTVTAADLVAIQSLILFSTTTFPNGTPSWRFVPADHVFTNPAQPFPFPQNMTLQNVMEDYTSAHFTGIKTGDVSGNANPAQLTAGSGEWAANDGAEERSGGLFLIKTAERQLSPGEVVEVVFETEDVAAWQLTLEFDRQMLEFQEVKKMAGETAPVFGLSRTDEGVLMALHFGDKPLTHFTLQFRVLKNTKLSEVLHVSSRYTPALAWSHDDVQMEVKLDFESSGMHPATVFYQNQPNPFALQTAIGFELPESGPVKFTFFDASGKILKSVEADFEMGYNQLIVRRKDLATTGVVYYRAESAQGAGAGKMVVD